MSTDRIRDAGVAGQLYVAFSRVGSFEKLHVLARDPDDGAKVTFIDKNPGIYTRNIVYQEVLRRTPPSPRV